MTGHEFELRGLLVAGRRLRRLACLPESRRTGWTRLAHPAVSAASGSDRSVRQAPAVVAARRGAPSTLPGAPLR